MKPNHEIYHFMELRRSAGSPAQDFAAGQQRRHPDWPREILAKEETPGARRQKALAYLQAQEEAREIASGMRMCFFAVSIAVCSVSFILGFLCGSL